MRRLSTSTSVVALVVVSLAAAYLLDARRSVPMLVDDAAGLMNAEQRARLGQYHAFLLADHDIDYRVVTADGIGDVNLYAVEQFAALDVGGRSGTGRGLLLVIDATHDEVRLEVGHALEGVYPDAFIAYIEQRQMVPFFRVEHVADGILAATELIVTRAQRARANAGFDDEVWFAGSGGGGATTGALVGEGADRTFRGDTGAGVAGASPKETLGLYFEAMQARNGSPGLAIYTPATRRMLEDWVMTAAQMDNVVETYRRCHPQEARTGPSGRRAVIRYPIAERACAPWFFERVGDRWALDLTMMQHAIRFGRSNAWRFTDPRHHAYAFAFTDWRFDAHGFPIE